MPCASHSSCLLMVTTRWIWSATHRQHGPWWWFAVCNVKLFTLQSQDLLQSLTSVPRSWPGGHKPIAFWNCVLMSVSTGQIEWRCFCYFIRNSPEGYLHALLTRNLLNLRSQGGIKNINIYSCVCMCGRPLPPTKRLFPPLPTRPLGLVLAAHPLPLLLACANLTC